jgi:acyl dehydratase
MYVDREMALSLVLEPLHIDVERGQLRLFAKATGETDPIYTDVEAARAAGYPDLPAPPSFLGNAIELAIPEPLSWLAAVGVDISNTLHGEQALDYHAMAFAGDRLTFHRSISDVYLKKGGTLEFVVKKSTIMRGEELIAEAYCSIVALHPEAAA